MATEEKFLWREYISAYHCYLITINYNTLASNLYVITLIYLLLSECSHLIEILAPLTVVPVSTTLEFKYSVL